MDTITLLSRYKMSIVSDEDAFSLLSLLYRDGPKTEIELCEAVPIPGNALKGKLRELFNAKFVTIGRSSTYFLTPFADNVLSRVGINDVVRESVLSSLTSRTKAKDYCSYVSAVSTVEREIDFYSVQAIRNLQKYIFVNEIKSVKIKEFLTDFCLSEFASRLDKALDPHICSLIRWDGDPQMKLEEMRAINMSISNFILGTEEKSRRKFSATNLKYAAEFKIIHYMLTQEFDPILEFATDIMRVSNKKSKKNVFARILEGISKKFSVETLISRFGASHWRLSSDDTISSAFEKVVDYKRAKSSIMSIETSARPSADFVFYLLEDKSNR